MNAPFNIVASVRRALFALGQLPALAQYANEFTPAKLIKQGKTSSRLPATARSSCRFRSTPTARTKPSRSFSSTNSGRQRGGDGNRPELDLPPGPPRRDADHVLLRLHAEVQRQVGRERERARAAACRPAARSARQRAKSRR